MAAGSRMYISSQIPETFSHIIAAEWPATLPAAAEQQISIIPHISTNDVEE
jgi:hypothetical protein